LLGAVVPAVVEEEVALVAVQIEEERERERERGAYMIGTPGRNMTAARPFL
jgi:hypothetical protein